MTHQSGTLFVIKVYLKRSLDENLQEYETNLLLEKGQLTGLPNLLPYDVVLQTEKAGFAIRQYIHSSLYDRISTRPFLSSIEKQWISYQLLSGLVECHARFRYHGDIRTENIMITSWNWAYLVDFSCFKPVFLPDDDPSNFSLFFDASARRSCYIAPERFTSPGSHPDFTLTPEMDIFALGCTIAEIFLEGAPLFTLSQLLRYRKHEYDPLPSLEKIENEGIKSMVAHMIALNPEDRFRAQEYLRAWRETAFPEEFYSFLYPYCANLSDPSFAHGTQKHHVLLAANPRPLVTDCDARIELIYNDFSMILKTAGVFMSKDVTNLQSLKQMFPVCLAIPNFQGLCTNIIRNEISGESDICLIVCTLITSCVRNCLFPASKIIAIDMLLALGIQLNDHYKIDRIVPYLVLLLKDENVQVRVNALVALTQLLSLVSQISQQDTNLFPDYLLPALKSFSSDSSVLARSSYAQCISNIAESALMFLELAELLEGGENVESEMLGNIYPITYDTNLKDLQDQIQEEVICLLTDSDSSVKQALLSEMPRLCIFFGKQKANDFLISHIITYLNDPDWNLRAAFCEAIVGVGTFSGTVALEQFILPLLVMALTDAEEAVVEKVLNSMTSLAELGLIQKSKMKELCGLVVPLVCHPNRMINYATIGYICSICKILSPIEVKSAVLPLIKPFSTSDVFILTEQCLMRMLKRPISRESYDYAVDFIVEKKKNTKSYAESDFMTSLKALGMSVEEKEKIDALKLYISKAGNSKLRSLIAKTVSLEYIALREHDIIPHTVFLVPEDGSLNGFNGKTPELSIASLSKSDNNVQKRPVSGLRTSSTQGRFSRNTSLANFNSASPSSEKGSNDRISGLSFVSAKSKLGIMDMNSIVDGQEKHIGALLEKKRQKMAPPLLPELGERGKKVGNIQNIPSSPTVSTRWTPKGTLVAHFPEHKGPVNDIQMAPDLHFFASCSDDGTVKIWDTYRLHTNVVNRARLTYSGHDSPVKALSFIEGRHSIASSSLKGQIHISRVEYIKSPGRATRYDSYSPITALTLNDDYATMVAHHDTENSSLLIYGTKKGYLTAIDLRSMKAAWSFEPPPHYGQLTSMITDRAQTWIMAGTHRGVLALWDTRFSIMVKSWQHPSKRAISKLDLYPIAPQGKPFINTSKLVCMSVENEAKEISVWDIESAECHQVWSAFGSDESDPIGKANSIYGNNFKALRAPESFELLDDPSSSLSLYTLPRKRERRTFALNTQLRCMVSGGSDRKLRFHDLIAPEHSYIYSGLGPNATQPMFNSHTYQDTFFNTEHYEPRPFGAPSRNPSEFSLNGATDFSASATPESHLDSITAMVISKVPSMIISGSRDGVIKVFQ